MGEPTREYKMRPIDVGQFLEVGKNGRVREQLEVVAEWQGKFVLRKVGAVPKAGVDKGLFDFDVNLVEQGKVGRFNIYGQLSRAEYLAMIEEAKGEKLVDPISIAAKQVGEGRLARNVPYFLRIKDTVGYAVRGVEFLGKSNKSDSDPGLVYFRREAPVDEVVNVALSRTDRGVLVFTEGVVAVPRQLIAVTPKEPGITIWKPRSAFGG